MTKKEYEKCIRLMEQAINNGIRANENWKLHEELEKQGKTIDAEIKQRTADQLHGECIGMNQVLAVLGFKHDRMKKLSELI